MEPVFPFVTDARAATFSPPLPSCPRDEARH